MADYYPQFIGFIFTNPLPPFGGGSKNPITTGGPALNSSQGKWGLHVTDDPNAAPAAPQICLGGQTGIGFSSKKHFDVLLSNPDPSYSLRKLFVLGEGIIQRDPTGNNPAIALLELGAHTASTNAEAPSSGVDLRINGETSLEGLHASVANTITAQVQSVLEVKAADASSIATLRADTTLQRVDVDRDLSVSHDVSVRNNVVVGGQIRVVYDPATDRGIVFSDAANPDGKLFNPYLSITDIDPWLRDVHSHFTVEPDRSQALLPDPRPEKASSRRSIEASDCIWQAPLNHTRVNDAKYICIGQSPNYRHIGSRYGVTIRNSAHYFCSLRVLPASKTTKGPRAQAGDTILSWGSETGKKCHLRFRYEGWDHGKDKPRDVVVIEKGGRTGGKVTVLGGITSMNYYYRSDARLKEAIEPIHGALDKVLGMRGVSFKFKDPSRLSGLDEGQDAAVSPFADMSHAVEDEDDDRRLGLLAQDVERVCPEIVATDDDGYKSMDATQLNAVLVEAIKDQQRIIDEQESRLKAQQGRLDRLEKALAKLGVEI